MPWFRAYGKAGKPPAICTKRIMLCLVDLARQRVIPETGPVWLPTHRGTVSGAFGAAAKRRVPGLSMISTPHENESSSTYLPYRMYLLTSWTIKETDEWCTCLIAVLPASTSSLRLPCHLLSQELYDDKRPLIKSLRIKPQAPKCSGHSCHLPHWKSHAIGLVKSLALAGGFLRMTCCATQCR